ncbi:hypothetical protein HPC38_02420 [Pasteurellaceae bacterium HPA106]|uniref:hypothetical protein n=1 Tax=Spirabiliibacterium pneumoniae TaxID=221400 RepID=UPI001AAC7249|nr:hypothetical protein [Spirabiliibacterium pneumoniae]MBE2895734.1 hypothetical protein [Spirabiliibacterium pneumoniae]
MKIKYINISTKRDTRDDIVSILKTIQKIIDEPENSFTFLFKKCEYLGCASISILGAIANLLSNLYRKERRNILSSISSGGEWTTKFKDEIQNIFDAVLREDDLRNAIYYHVENVKKKNKVNTNEALKIVMTDIINHKEFIHLLTTLFIERHAKKIGVMFDVNSMKNQLRKQLINCNFLSHYHADFKTPYPEGKYIGFREHKRSNEGGDEKIINHIQNEWLTNEKIHLSPLLKQDIVSRIFELYQNAFGHGVSKALEENNNIDVVSCGSYDNGSKTISLCIIDLGGGICKNVLEYTRNFNHLCHIDNDQKALAWALKRGNSTKTDSIDEDMPRGVGLDILKEFVVLNKGKLEIYTNSCRAFIGESGEYEIEELGFNFGGTLAFISINCQEDVVYLYQHGNYF